MMKVYSRGESHLETIKYDINKKYKITNPIFIVCGCVEKDETIVIEWMNKWLCFERDNWIKYKYKRDNVFELKEYLPSPPGDVCWKMADDFIRAVKQNEDAVFFKISSVIYDVQEARRELFFGLKEGYSELSAPLLENPIPDPNPNLNRLIYVVHFQEGQTDLLIESGYFQLEQK